MTRRVTSSIEFRTIEGHGVRARTPPSILALRTFRMGPRGFEGRKQLSTVFAFGKKK